VPLHKAASEELKVQGNYIVVFSNNASTAELSAFHDRITKTLGVVMDREWTIIPGFSAKLTPEQLSVLLQEDKLISFIEEDQKVSINQDCNLQETAEWNLVRISSRQPYPVTDDEYYWGPAGQMVIAYVIDTGIRITHEEFTGSGNPRAIWGENFVGDGVNQDCNGHGTHVAGTIAGNVYGLAKGTTVIAVKVLDCGGSGSYAGVVSGVDYAAEDCATHGGRRCTANMSLGGPPSASLDTAVANAVLKGITMVIAAGNSNANACNYSPARTGGNGNPAITVAANNQAGSRASFSNWGPLCVDIFAPGQSIYAAYATSDTSYATLSGTSMAAPHVCGVACLVLDANPGFSPADLKGYLVSTTVANIGFINLACSGACASTPNVLVFNTC
jgi:subtilisin family serine protease